MQNDGNRCGTTMITIMWEYLARK